MIKPVPCAVCGSLPRISIYEDACTGKLIHCIFHEDITIGARSALGAIIRWNWRQWRARRKPKGEATT